MSDADELVLTTEPDAAVLARRWVGRRLDLADASLVADAQVVVSELVTNAQLHGLPPVTVRVLQHEDRLRVEVGDLSPHALVRPVPSSEAMTGRGLALVAGMSDAWGVDAHDGRGKVVWAELVSGTSEEQTIPDIDAEAFLASWQEDDDEELFTVQLGAVPTGLLLEAKRHIDNVVRELTLERAGASGPLPPEVEALIETVTSDFARARAGIKEQAAAAAARGDRQTELVLTLPASSVRAGERYLAALDEADRYARASRMLTLETPSLHKLFRRWYVSALVDQLQGLVRGRPAGDPLPFVEVLVEEVGQLADLRDTAHRLDLLQRVSAALAEVRSTEAMVSTVLSSAVRELGAVTARVYVAQDGVLRSVGHQRATSRASPTYDDIALDADLPGAAVHRGGRPLVFRTLAELTERFPVLAGVYDSERVLHVVPLEAGGHRLGVLALGFPPTSRYDEHSQTAYVRALADVLAQGLERIDVTNRLEDLARTPHEAQARPTSAQVAISGSGEQRLSSLADAARAIAGAGSVEALLAVAAEAAQDIVGAHQAVATRLYGVTWEHAITHVSLSDAYAQWRDFDQVPEGRGVLNQVTRENRPLRLTGDQLQRHPEFRGLRDAPGHPPLPDYLAAPLTSREGINIGLIQLSHKVDGSAFDPSDEAVAVQVALMVSAAIEHVETAQQLEQAMSRLRRDQQLVEALHDVGLAVTSSLEHQDVVQRVTDAATTMTGAQFGAFFYNVVQDDGAEYVLYTISGVPREAFSRFPMPRSTEIFGPTFQGTGVVRLTDVTADPRYGQMAPYFGMPAGHLPVTSYLAVPVRLSSGEVIGGLFFGHSDEGVFDQEAERLAVGIAGYAAIALENGRLYDAARRESRAQEEIAAALERPLQPPTLPQIEGAEVAALFEPLGGTGQVGGDFYDVFAVEDGRWLLLLGDVAGKGPEAAAVAGLVRHTIYGAAQFTVDPAKVLEAVNHALLRQETERFATLVVAVLRPITDGLEVVAAWAGHPPGLVIRSGAVDLVSGPGLPVGMFPDLGVQAVSFTLARGETLLLHTDGLVERSGALLDEDDLIALAVDHAAEDVRLLLAAVASEVSARYDARDDVAALALRAV